MISEESSVLDEHDDQDTEGDKTERDDDDTYKDGDAWVVDDSIIILNKIVFVFPESISFCILCFWLCHHEVYSWLIIKPRTQRDLIWPELSSDIPVESVVRRLEWETAGILLGLLTFTEPDVDSP